MKVIKKTIIDNKKAWVSHIRYALWANRISTKRDTDKSPFQLVYGLEWLYLLNWNSIS